MKKLYLVPILVFVIAAGAQFLMNVTNVFETDWGTWQVIINAGIVAVVGWVVAYATSIKSDIEQLKTENEILNKLVNKD